MRTRIAQMVKQKRLIRIETSLTPKQAVLLWLRQEHQGKTSGNYARWLIERPPSASPRPRVGKQVVDAIRAAMKGQDPERIHRAIRQGHMHTDFLILLVNKMNWIILDGSQVRWLKIAFLHERIQNIGCSDDDEEVVNEWVAFVRDIAIDLFSLEAASDLIRDRFFDGECILLKDTSEELTRQKKLMQHMMDAYDHVATDAGRSDLASDPKKFQETVSAVASKKADYIVALAKSKMLEDFGEHEAADATIKPYFLESLDEKSAIERIT